MNNEYSNNELSLREVISILFRYRNNLIWSILFSLILVFLVNSIFTKNWKATSTIIIEEKDKTMSSLLSMGLGGEENFLRNEIEVIKSRTVAERTIKKLLDSDKGNDLITLRTKKNDYTIAGSLVRNMLFVSSEIYAAEAMPDSIFQMLTTNLQRNTSVTNPRNTDVLKITTNAKTAEEAALIVNTLVEVYKETDQQWISGEMTYLESFLEEQLKYKFDELSKIEDQLKIFQEEEKIFALSGNAELILEQLIAVESDYYITEAEANIFNKRKEYYLNQLNDDEKELAKSITNTTNAQLLSGRKELAILEAEFLTTKSKEGPNHPALKDLNVKINNLKKSLAEETDKYIDLGVASSDPLQFRQALMDTLIQVGVRESGLRDKQSELLKVVSVYNDKLQELPEKALIFARYERDKVILAETYSLMKSKLEEARITKASQLGKVRLVDVASIPRKSASIGIFNLIILSILIGIGFGTLLIIIIEFLDNTIKSIEELEKRGISILSIVPELKDVKKSKNKKDIQRKIIMEDDPKSTIAEAYRVLRTSLSLSHNKQDGVGKQTILVSSSSQKEGKSTTVANLAISYALTGKKVLIIDCDLRKPVIHKIFNADKLSGLTTFIANSNKIENYIQKTKIQNLDVLTSGSIPPNPSEILGSENMKLLMENLKKKWDYIILDTPPLIAVTDASIITKYVDTFLLVVRAGIAQKRILSRVISMLNQINVKIDGAVFNGVSASNSYYGDEYYNYYQYYYGNEEEDK